LTVCVKFLMILASIYGFLKHVQVQGEKKNSRAVWPCVIKLQ
jgi:hypothetical protein